MLLPFTVAAMYRLQQIGDPSAFSPSGSEVAFVVKRPLDSAKNTAQAFLQDDDVADVYVHDVTSGRTVRITDGARDGAGFWDPQWSPDGKRIAMLSTRGDNVYLGVWDAVYGLRRITDRAVELGWQRQSFQWVSNDRLLCQVMPEGEKPLSMSVETETPEAATKAWPLDWRGRVSTANVLESGVTPNVRALPQSALLLLDLSVRRERVVAVAEAASFAGVTLSHNHRFAAALEKVGILTPRAGRRFQSDFDNGIYQLAVYDMRNGERLVRYSNRLVGSAPVNWSPDDRDIAFLGEPATALYKSHLGVFRCSLSISTCSDLLPRSLSVDLGPNGTKTTPLWSATGALIAYAQPSGKTDSRWDWYALRIRNRPVNVSGMLKSAPSTLVSSDEGRRFLGLADGKIVEVFPSGARPRPLLFSRAPRFDTILWPAGEGADDYLILTARHGRRLLSLDLRSGRLVPLSALGSNEELNAALPARGEFVLAESNRNGSFLYEIFNGRKSVLYEANRWLSHYAEGRLVNFSYRSLSGKTLDAWILLPPHHVTGGRHPSVVWVYAGSVMSSERPPYLASLNLVHALNMQLLAAQGYAIIFPSMPLPPFGQPSDPYDKLTDGVMPAIDKAIALGYTDERRIAVMGQSYGGFSTYALVTQTNRFKAAIALAGISDWTSLYGAFDARQRYESNYNWNDEFSEQLMEDGQGNFGAPPWVAPARYAHNSPLTYAARVRTPLLIIQGDLDYVSMQQGEEFFTALYRQGRRAEFVRYWGEEHVLRSEANIADCWRRITAWLRAFLG